jgi:disease resistance protein RPM1
MGALPGKILELLKEEYKLQTGVRGEVEFLSRELESMHTALCKVAQVPPDKLDPQAKLWARDVREASYGMEDILDAFLVRVDGGGPEPADTDKVRRRLLKKMGKLFGFRKLAARHDIATAIVGIRKQLEEMAARHARYRVDHLVMANSAAAAAAPASVDPRLNALYRNSSELVGMQEPRDALVEMIMPALGKEDRPTEMMKIVSIVGSAGLGKTTLAKAAYDKISQNFDCCAFVPVGQNPVPKKVLKGILSGLIRHETRKNERNRDQMQKDGNDHGKKRYTVADLVEFEAEDLISELREFLQGKRYGTYHPLLFLYIIPYHLVLILKNSSN